MGNSTRLSHFSHTIRIVNFTARHNCKRERRIGRAYPEMDWPNANTPTQLTHSHRVRRNKEREKMSERNRCGTKNFTENLFVLLHHDVQLSTERMIMLFVCVFFSLPTVSSILLTTFSMYRLTF